jgi:D-alanyl-D-alanine dipeptidase
VTGSRARRPALALALLALAACASAPPRDPRAAARVDLVDLAALVADLRVELRYASADNFLGEPVYPADARAYLQRPAAEALARVAARLAGDGVGLLVYDAYRPWRVTKLFWDRTPREKRAYVADPRQGSRHNRGCAVDLTLIDLATGRALPMPSDYDDFSERAHPDYAGGTVEERANRDLLRAAMEAEGFAVHENEWWHFDFAGWERYPVLDLSLERLTRGSPAPCAGCANGH